MTALWLALATLITPPTAAAPIEAGGALTRLAAWASGLLRSLGVSFEEPSRLWLIVGGALLAGLCWLVMRAVYAPRRHAWVLIRVLLVAALAACLAEAASVRRTDQTALIAVLDLSGSVQRFVAVPPPAAWSPAIANSPPGAAGQVGAGPAANRSATVEAWLASVLRSATRNREPRELLGVVVATDRAIPVASPQAGGVLGRSLTVPPSEATDLAAALKLALASIPPTATGRVLLISDGNQTAGDALAAADVLASAGEGGASVPIDVIELVYDLASEVLVESVEAPTRAPAASVAPVRVTLLSTAPTTGTLRLLVEGVEVPIGVAGSSGTGAAERGRVLTLPQGRTSITLSAPLGPGRVHRFEAVWEPQRGPDASGAMAALGDTIEQNNRGLAVTTTPGRGSVLILDGIGRGAPDSRGRVLETLLRRQGFDVTTLPPEGLPTDVLALQPYDLVVLQDVPAEAVPAETQALLVRHVSDFGAGLIMTGGTQSFGAGGWRGSAVEPILPVTLDLPDKLVVASTALVIVLDSSGSMGRSVLGSLRTQQLIANFGAAAAIKSLERSDLVGVVRFDSSARWVVPLAPNTDPAKAGVAVMGIMPNGGTNLPPGLTLARAALKNVKAQVKHVVVLSDGLSQGRDQLNTIASEMAGEGIRITTIAVGDEADADGLERLASVGGGSFYRVTDPEVLPRVFLRAVRVVRTPMVREEPFVPVATSLGSPLTAGVFDRGAAVPALGGLTLTQPKLGADRQTVEGVTYSLLTPTGEPVLAHWSVGLGQVAAFTSDVHNWGRSWDAWPQQAPLWGQIARAIARAPADQLADLALRVEGESVRARLELLDRAGKPLDGLSVPIALFRADGSKFESRLSQTGPGVYEGTVIAPGSGTLVALATPKRAADSAGNGAVAMQPIVGGVVRPPGEEYRRLRSSPQLLAELARRTGGRVLTIDRLAGMDARELFVRDERTSREARTPLWPVLLPIALGLLLLDVGVRRVAWERLRDGRVEVDPRVREVADSARRLAQRVTSRRPEVSAAEASPQTGTSQARAPQVPAPQARPPQAPPQVRPQQAGGAPVVVNAPDEPSPPVNEGLLAAKRRAQQRIDEQRR